MDIKDSRIDSGKAFDWGRVSKEYAKYRDIYPKEFYQKIVDLNLCVKGQKVLDLGTGTGVIPRNMYEYGADFVGTDISENQIKFAKILAQEKNQNIQFLTSSAEEIPFEDNTFDVITACQCFFYFDHPVVMPKLAKLLKPDGKLVILYMTWLPMEDKIAGLSEQLVLKYNPTWSGAGETKHPIDLPDCVNEYFEVIHSEEYDIDVPFTLENWHGRMKACRGVGASLTEEQINEWEKEHLEMLKENAEPFFKVKHYGAIKVLKVRK